MHLKSRAEVDICFYWKLDIHFPFFWELNPFFFPVKLLPPAPSYSVQHDWVKGMPSLAPRGTLGTGLANYSGSVMGIEPDQKQWAWILRFLLGGEKWLEWDISWNSRQLSDILGEHSIRMEPSQRNAKLRDGKRPILKTIEALGLDASEVQIILLNFSGIWLINYANQ